MVLSGSRGLGVLHGACERFDPLRDPPGGTLRHKTAVSVRVNLGVWLGQLPLTLVGSRRYLIA